MNKLLLHLQKAGLNGFFLFMLMAVLLSWLFPFYGTARSPLPLGLITQYGIPVIFFFYGVRLSPEQLRAGLGNWKLHLLIQSTTFVLFPLIVLLFSFLRNEPEYHLLWFGSFYLAALPSTVSSSVVMVSIAHGNLPAAIFNASLSSMLGIFITPLWMSFFIKEAAGPAQLTDVIVKLCLQVLVPVILGLLLHKRLGRLAEKNKTALRYFDQSVILLIIYTTFCESFSENIFSHHSFNKIALLAALMLAFFLIMFGLMQLIASYIGFSRADRITILFCGSKKSLVQGALMGRLIFPNPVTFGVILLPLILYHALQLLVGSAIAERMGKKEPGVRSQESGGGVRSKE